jgi:hypothetical protein
MRIGAFVGAALFGITLTMVSAPSAFATVRIVGDAGGQIGPWRAC